MQEKRPALFVGGRGKDDETMQKTLVRTSKIPAAVAKPPAECSALYTPPESPSSSRACAQPGVLISARRNEAAVSLRRSIA